MFLQNHFLPLFSSDKKSVATIRQSPRSKPSKIATALSAVLPMMLMANVASAQSVSGVVVDTQGQPIKMANININGSERKIQTNEQGEFILTNVNEGDIELHISAKNYSHKNAHIVINENDVSGLTIALSPSVMEVLDIYATPLHSSAIESALPINVLAGDELKLKQASTLGETLKNEVGVHSSFYGGVASSPIIRGLDGPRVLITQNGLDVGDASRVGADHAISTETSTAVQIEVLRGPSTLFYGSGAIGGVVNVVDKRVPTSNETMAEWLLQYNGVSDEKQAGLSLQKGLEIGGEKFAVHLDGYWRDAGNYKLPKDFEAEEEHEDHEEDDHDDHEEEANSDTLADSYSESSGFTIGSSYLFEQGFVGFSYGSISKDYGIPGHVHHHEEEEGEEHDEHEELEVGTSAEMRQDRVQLLSEVNFDDSFLKQVSAKFAYTDYQHKEIEDGALGTTFNNESSELKVDLYHQTFQGWKGAWTLHYKGSDFEAIGDEAFTPPSKTDSFAAAWLEEKHFGDVLVQLGARIEQVSIEADDTLIGFDDHEQELVSFEQQDFTPISASAGFVWDYQDGYNLGLSVALSQRAPSASELFSFGPHIGTNTFEIGAMFELHIDEDEDEGHGEEDHEHDEHGDEVHVELAENEPVIETSHSIDLTWRKFEGDFGFVVSAFYNRVNDFYFQQDTGLVYEDEHEEHEEETEEEHEEHEEEGLPILIYQQADVEMYGLEAEVAYQISSPLKLTVFGDYINAKLTNGDYLPRTPPMRLGSALNYQANSFTTELSVNHYFEQDNTAPLETATGAYTIVDFNFNYYLSSTGLNIMDNDIVLYVKGQNLTDELGFVHSSFLKEDAPLPGRSFSIGIRGSF